MSFLTEEEIEFIKKNWQFILALLALIVILMYTLVVYKQDEIRQVETQTTQETFL